jgi:hypothetical protein
MSVNNSAGPINFYVEINETDDSPDDWQIRHIEMTITANNEEEAEDFAGNFVTALKGDLPTDPMEINQIYELA